MGFLVWRRTLPGGLNFVFEGNLNYWLILSVISRLKSSSSHVNLIRSDLVFEEIILRKNAIAREKQLQGLKMSPKIADQELAKRIEWQKKQQALAYQTEQEAKWRNEQPLDMMDWLWGTAVVAPVMAPSLLGAAETFGSAAMPYITGALETSIPGMAGVPGATVGNALGSYFAADAIVNRLPEVPGKQEIISEGDRRILEIEDYYAQGLLTQSERHAQVIKVWTEIKDRISDLAKNILPKQSSAYTMIESGARGSMAQLTQTIGMIGLKSSPSGDIIELPVKSSFKDGVSVLEFFISSHGVRKGLTDTALKTANAGYLTRRLVDVAQDVVVREEDCGDEMGVVITHKESEEIGEALSVRILGRYAMSDIFLPGEKKPVIMKDELITEEHIRAVKKSGKDIQEAHVRSVMTCKIRRGVCQKCYGYDLAHNKLVKMGTAVGIIAAQSIGEPGTQLTMRTFHTGGVAGKDITQGLPRVEELFEARLPKRKAVMTEVSGIVEVEKSARTVVQIGTGKEIVDTAPGQKIVRVRHSAVDEKNYVIGRGGKALVSDGDKVRAGDAIAEKTSGEKILSEVAGTAKTSRGVVTIVHDAEKVREYIIPHGYSLYVKDGDEVQAGDALTDGHLDLQALFKAKGQYAVQMYLSKEMQFIYSSQGQKLNNKHIEVIIRQMFSRVRVTEIGDSELLPGEVIEKATYLDEYDRMETTGGKLPECEQLLLGVTKVSLSTESWLSSSSFQETARVLINAAVTGKIDGLGGLKENVIIGRLIPTGTGFEGNEISLDDRTDKVELSSSLISEVPQDALSKEIAETGPQMGAVVAAEAAEKSEE
ncbi:hypothetical protein EBT25_10705 [bacterium]|nr:hypothetical protein [bacterium]